jgi:hypothetical protein
MQLAAPALVHEYTVGCILSGFRQFGRETGKNSGVSCCSKQGRGWLKDRGDGQYRQVWLLPKPLPQVAIHYGGSHLQHEMSACLRPPHLLALDDPFCDQRIDRGSNNVAHQ